MGGEEKTVTSTQNSDPWGPQQPYLARGFSQAEGLLNRGPAQYYPGQTVADMPSQTQTGIDVGTAQAGANSSLIGRTVGGEFLNAGNPYFQGMVNQIGQAIRPNIDSAFASTGRLGSGAHANAYASSLADQAGKLAYQNYGAERQNQIAASQDYSPYQALMNFGGAVENKDNQYIADAMKRWDTLQNADQTALANYMNVVGNRSYGTQGTSSTPYTSNSTLQTIGAGAGLLGGIGQLATGIGGLLR